MALNARQQRFAQEYLIDLNATAAYKRAGYAANGRAAENNASRLLGHAGVAAAIAAGQAKRSERTEVTQDWVLKKLKEEAERMGPEGSPSARVAALKLLGHHAGLKLDKVTVEGGASPIILKVFEETVSAGNDETNPDVPSAAGVP